MLAATFLAIFFVPMFFKIITARKLREQRSTEEITLEAKHAHAGSSGALHHPHRAPGALPDVKGEPA
jgi:hypothetical protein